ncbi:MAG: hypothetical protein AAFQ98_06900 [Bacteroidota bacterium]
MKTFLQTCSVLSLLLLAQCGGGEKSTPAQNQSQPPAQQEVATITPGENFFSVRSASGTYEVFVEGSDLALEGPNMSWLGEDKGEKRKFYDPSGDVTMEVKFSDEDKFKLRNSDGTLRWKVKVYEDKVKVADNEEMDNPYEIRLYEGGRIKLKRNEEELAEWRVSNQAVSELTREGLTVSGLNQGFARGAFLIEELTMEEQLVLAAELFVR